jgi:hypothetical protein
MSDTVDERTHSWRNRDRDAKHRRRREVGTDTDRPDGIEAARKLYGPVDADASTDTRDENPTLFNDAAQ